VQWSNSAFFSGKSMTNQGFQGLRICHLAKYYAPAKGGIETHVRTLAHSQVRMGAKVQVVCINHADSRGQDITHKTFGVSDSSDEQDGEVLVHRVGKRATLARFDFCPGLKKVLRQFSNKADLFHLHVPNPTMLIALSTIRHQLPTVIGYHSDIVKQRFLAKGFQPFERRVFNRAARIFVASPYYHLGSPLLQQYPLKLETVPYGLELETYTSPLRQSREFTEQLRARLVGPIWLCVGRLVYYKGLQNAIEALRHVPGNLVIIGKGPLEWELKKQARICQVEDRISWYYSMSDVELIGAYHAATALWLPSNARSEAFGIVQIEAMACGCPVINTEIPHSGAPWVSQHDVSGLTVSVDQPTELAAAARRLLEETGLRERLSAGALARSRSQFTNTEMARRIQAIYDKVLNRQTNSQEIRSRDRFVECRLG
jgi:glycosyltransferase involved in cell wall biosynthesis